jgi:drug/metabolite transporter (DMT)-like permease
MWISVLALLLVLLSAGLHATWNVLVKRGEDTLIATWLTAIVAPVVLWPLLLLSGLPPPPAWPMLLASGTIHAAYNVAVAPAYKYGDLSVVYPVARGLAPLLVGGGAPLILGESLSPAAMAAILLVGGGVAWLGLSARRTRTGAAGLMCAGLTAVLIAAYSLVDKVRVMRSHPLAYAVTLFWCDAVFVTPYVLLRRNPRQIHDVWHGNRAPLVWSGLLALAAYLLVLVAMRLTQVSYVAALRESSVILGAILGWRVLGGSFREEARLGIGRRRSRPHPARAGDVGIAGDTPSGLPHG